MTITALTLTLLLPACTPGGSVVLTADSNPTDDTATDDTATDDTATDDTATDDTGTEPTVRHFSGTMVALSEWNGQAQELCTGELEFTLEGGEFAAESPCQSQWMPGMVFLDGRIDGSEVSGTGTMTASIGGGGGDPLEETGRLTGELSGDVIEAEFEVEFELGGGQGGSYDIPVRIVFLVEES